MKRNSRLRSSIGLMSAMFLILACTFTVEVLPTETPVAPTFTPDLPEDLPTATFTEPVPTVELLAATPTLISIRLGMTSMLEIFMNVQGGEVPRAVAFTPDGSVVAAAGGNTEDFGIYLWEVATGKPIGILGGHAAFISGQAFSHDGHMLVSVSEDGTAKVWDWRNGDQIKTLEFSSGVYSVRFSPDGQTLAIGGVDEPVGDIRNAAIWTFAVGSWNPMLKYSEYWNVSGMAYSPDGRWLVGGGTSRNVQVWRTSDGTRVYTLNHSHQVGDIAISPDGSTVATATCINVVNQECSEGGIWLWDLVTGKLLRKLSGFPNVVEGVEFTADGSMLIGASRDGVLQFFSTTDYQPVFEAAPPGGNGVLALSSDSGLLATATNSGEVRLWKVVYRP